MNVYEIVTERVLERMEELKEVPWRKPWSSLGAFPSNPISKTQYRGANLFLLNMLGFSEPYFMTWKQIEKVGANVIEGEQKKWFPVIYFNWIESKDDKKKKIPMLKYYRVYNVSQVENLPEGLVPEVELKDNSPIEECESIVEKVSPTITTDKDGAFYNPSEDYINIPFIEKFESSEEYYSTLFHETVHWTGHKDRLNRKGIVEQIAFGSHRYSNEELVAEMGASYLCNHVGIINRTIDNSATYLNSWMRKLKDEPRCFINSAQAAQKAVDLILGKSFDS
jgi:antirestriction protein ArdC